jgi:8-oxo-dGTP pyrophosphatase MutT (NUDIX family)
MKENRNNNIKPVTAAGGVVYRDISGQREVLLILRNGRWELPKGGQEKNESIIECARREIMEETGIENPVVKAFLTKTVHSYKRNNQMYRKTTHWFKVDCSAKESLVPQVEEGIEQVCWVPLKEAGEKVFYENLKEVMRAFQTAG